MASSILRRLAQRLPIARYVLADATQTRETSPGAPAAAPVSAARVEQRLAAIESQLAAWQRVASSLDDSLATIAATGITANILDRIRLVDVELMREPRYADPSRLLRFGGQVCSQNGEDGMIQEIFRRIGVTTRVFAEVGVEDGVETNTTFLLSLGWSGFWFDGADAFIKTLASRPEIRDRVRHAVAHLTRENVGSVFATAGVPKEFDLLSLDIDQNTFYIWEALADYRPRAVVVEYNATIPPGIDWKVRYRPDGMWDGSANFGASLKAYEQLGRALGYVLVGCDLHGINAFFVREDLAGDKFCEPFTAENHYEPPRYHLIQRRGHRRTILDSPVGGAAG